MYDFTDDERERFINCVWFRSACYNCYGNGMTKDEALSAMIIELLRERDERHKLDVERMMTSTRREFYGDNQ